MKKYQRNLAVFLLCASIMGCSQTGRARPGPASPGQAPSMPKMVAVSKNIQPAPVFGSSQAYAGSPVATVGHQGLFPVRSKKENEIAVLKNGEASFAMRVHLLKKARRSIRIQALIFTGDESGLYISEILKKKKAQGLDVRVIVDAPSNLGWQTQWMYFDLKQHGIEVQGYESLYLEWLNEAPFPFASDEEDSAAPNHRYHEKIWIVDGETDQGQAVIGGLNIANEYFRVDPSDPSRYWRDQDIVVRGSLVADMTTAFDRNHEHFTAIKKSRGALNTDLYWRATRQLLDKTGKPAIFYMKRDDLVQRVERMAKMKPALNFVQANGRFFHNRPRLGESYLQQAYRKLIDNAEREILICNAYFIPSPDLIEALKAAASRGVHITILSNSPETNDLPELAMVGRSYYKKILSINEDRAPQMNDGSVEIWEWHGQRYDQKQKTEGTIHAKYAVFDRRFALVGSYNLDPRSRHLNSETAVVFESHLLATELAETFYKNDLAYSRIVTMEDANAFKDPTDALYKLRKMFGSLFESQL